MFSPLQIPQLVTFYIQKIKQFSSTKLAEFYSEAGIILKLFLFFWKTEPQYSYKLYSYIKNVYARHRTIF